MKLSRKFAHLVLAALTAGGVLSGVVLAASPAAHAAFPGTNGPIVFVVFPSDLVKVDPATAIQTTICSGCASAISRPAVSSDGQTVAFEQTAGGPLGLISINGGSVTTVNGSVPGDADPTFTPDGSRLVFTSNVTGGALLTISATGGGGRTAIFGSPGATTTPEVSPDGSTVAFTEFGGANDTLFTIPIGGGAVTQRSVTLNGGAAGVPEDSVSWSPDGSKIAVFAPGACGAATPIGIVSATAVNAAPTCLPSSASGDTGPAWSPDGTKIVVVATSKIPTLLNASGAPGRTSLSGSANFATYWAVAASTTTTTSGGPTTTTTTPCFGTLSGTAFKGAHAKAKKALAGVTVSAAPTPTGTTLTGTTNAAGAYSFTVPCGTYNKTATGPANNSRTCHFGSGKGPATAVAQVTNGSNDVENLFCKTR